MTDTAPTVYHYDPVTKLYLGLTVAPPSPLEPGVFFTPANSTLVEPPTTPEGQVAVWGGEAWTLENAPLPDGTPNPTNAQVQTAAIQLQINTLESRQARPLRELAIAQAALSAATDDAAKATDSANVTAILARISALDAEIVALRAQLPAPAEPATPASGS